MTQDQDKPKEDGTAGKQRRLHDAESVMFQTVSEPDRVISRKPGAMWPWVAGTVILAMLCYHAATGGFRRSGKPRNVTVMTLSGPREVLVDPMADLKVITPEIESRLRQVSLTISIPGPPDRMERLAASAPGVYRASVTGGNLTVWVLDDEFDEEALVAYLFTQLTL